MLSQQKLAYVPHLWRKYIYKYLPNIYKKKTQELPAQKLNSLLSQYGAYTFHS